MIGAIILFPLSDNIVFLKEITLNLYCVLLEQKILAKNDYLQYSATASD